MAKKDAEKDAKNDRRAFSSKQAMWGWCSFDWANSAFPTLIVTFVFPAFFATAIVGDAVLGQIYWTQAIGWSALLVAVAAPLLGRLADRTGTMRSLLLFFSCATMLLCALLWFAVPGERSLLSVLLVVGLANVTFELSAFLYNALIPSLLPDKQRGALSGLAWGMGYLGGLSALLIALLLFIQPEQLPFGLTREGAEHVRAVFVLAGLWFFIFSLPFFWILFRRTGLVKGLAKVERRKDKDKRKLPKLLLWQGRGLSYTGRFLLARMLYSDGVTTIFAVGGIFAISVHDFSLQGVLLFGILMNITAALGAMVGGLIENRVGAIRIVRYSVIAVLLLGLGLIALPSKSLFWLCALTMGVFFGPLQSSSRVILSRLVPQEAAGQAFGWYALSGKATAFVGPLAVSAATVLFADSRLGLLPILLFLLGGALLLPKQDSAEGRP